MSLTVQVCDGLPADWARIAAGGPLLATPGWLRAMEGRLGERPVTIVVRDAGQARVAAFGAVQTVSRPGEFFDLHHVLISPAPALPLTERARAHRARLAASAPPPWRWVPSLVVMLPGYECVPIGPGAHDPLAVAVLVEGTLDWAVGEGLHTVAFLYTRPEDRPLATVLAGRGFVRVPLSLTWDLDLPGTCLADYLAWLPRKRRIETRRELRLLRESEVDIKMVDVWSVFDDLVRLRCQLAGKYRGQADSRVEDLRLRRLVTDVAAGRPSVLLATAGTAAVGFALFAEHDQTWHCLAVGYDYADSRSRLTYFGTAFYAAAEAAYAAGVRRLGYGQGAWWAKRARGCRATPLAGWIHTTDPGLAAAVRASAEITELIPLDPLP